jgi:hypothetical protein
MEKVTYRSDGMLVYAYRRLAEAGYLVIAPMLRGSGGAGGHDEMGGADVNDILNVDYGPCGVHARRRPVSRARETDLGRLSGERSRDRRVSVGVVLALRGRRQRL